MNVLDIEIMRKLLLEVRDASIPTAAYMNGPTKYWRISPDLYRRISQACRVFNL